MRVELRETGSILVQARRDEVLAILRRHVGDASMVAPDRIESPRSTYVLRDSGPGTRVIHARRESAPVTTATRGREELRREVAADLLTLQRVLDLERS